MKTSDFYFNLPNELIAQKPSEKRGEDRLLVLERKKFSAYLKSLPPIANAEDVTPCGLRDCLFSSLPDLIPKNALMVFNDSKVRRARLYGVSAETGGRAEFLLISPVLSSESGESFCWNAVAKRARRRRAGQKFLFPGDVEGKILDSPKGGQFRLIEFSRKIDDAWLDLYGHIPLPPYIRRMDTEEDASRYQTVYAKETGSMASPTAGLHFTDAVLNSLKERGVDCAYITLHVGLGTFLPVRTESLEQHKMHEEAFTIPEKTAAAITEARRIGRPIVAVGTTSVRALESAWSEEKKEIKAGSSSTSIFIYPGFRFKVVDALFTNFHTPASSLIMLVAAFAGKDEILAAYNYAVNKKYRFFSYGDCMLIL